MMRIGLGVFHWTEEEFWSTSLRAFNAAVRGYNANMGEDPGPSSEELRSMQRSTDHFPDVVESIAGG